MKNLNLVTLAFLTLVLFIRPDTTFAQATSGSGGDMNLAWACASLENYSSAYLMSYCWAWSQNSFLYRIDLYNGIIGEHAYRHSNGFCQGLGVYSDSKTYSTTDDFSQEVAFNGWTYAKANYSYDDEINGVLHAYDSEEGYENVEPWDQGDAYFQNVYGPCPL